MIDIATLMAVMQCDQPRAAKYHAPLVESMARVAIDTPLRIAHFLAQIGHESGGLKYTEELATGEAYEGRADLGNTKPGDGRRFKGRGLIQVTGRANYAAFEKACGEDLLTTPERLANDPRLAVDCATWFWTRHRLNDLADKDDLPAITRRINGGLNGLEDRSQRLGLAKTILRRKRST